MTIYQSYSLQPYHTFGVAAKARFFSPIRRLEDLRELIFAPLFDNSPKMILGGGSNVLFCKDYDGVVIHNQFKGIHVIKETEDHVWVMAYGGEVWHDLVMYCVDRNWGGIENLSLIPGSVGAAPMQNIGAYGVEIADTFVSLDAVHIKTGDLQTFYKKDCAFGYRTSVFKTTLKDQYFILSVTFKLNKKPQLQTNYGAVKKMLDLLEAEGTPININTLSKVIIAIRQSKLPDPKHLGNAGSFFKNPIIDQNTFEQLQQTYPNMPYYIKADSTQIKIPAAWLIEQCGWKGKKIGQTGTYERHALVLVNYGEAKGAEIWAVAQAIQQSVVEKFGLLLETEVNIIND